MLRQVILLLCLGLTCLAGSACTTTSEVSSSTPALEELNRRINDRSYARLVLSDGKTIKRAYRVKVGIQTTTYERTRGSQTIETSQIDRVEVPVGRDGRSVGFLIGTIPGLAFTALAWLTTWQSDSPWAPLGAYISTIIGVPSAVVGGFIGSFVGDLVDSDEMEVIYEGPVEEYLRSNPRE